MSLCVNPHCSQPHNRDDELFCLRCGSELLLQGRYRVTRQLGGGGFGMTFEVNEVRNNTPKVLKVLINNQQKAVELFQLEAAVLSHLNHPGIPKVERDAYFVYVPRNSQDQIHCLVMEKIIGMDLQKWMENRGLRPIDQTLAIQWLRELITILDQVHTQNFCHRDIKPPNIMLRADGHLALIDFGTVQAIKQTYWFEQAQCQVTGIISSGYTPKEQVKGQAVPQSDFYALGRTFVYLLVGKQPTHPAIYNSYTDEIHWRNHAAHISPQLGDLIDQMMARLISQRPTNTQIILQRLTEIEQALKLPQVYHKPTQSRELAQIKLIIWGFWLQWILATTVGGAVGFAMADAVVGAVVGAVESAVANALVGAVAGAMGFAVLGTVLGIMQWLVLRQHITRSGRWIWGTITGTVAGAVAGSVTGSVGGAIAGAVLGIAQLLILRRYATRSKWCILSGTLAGVLAGALAFGVGFAR